MTQARHRSFADKDSVKLQYQISPLHSSKTRNLQPTPRIHENGSLATVEFSLLPVVMRWHLR